MRTKFRLSSFFRKIIERIRVIMTKELYFIISSENEQNETFFT